MGEAVGEWYRTLHARGEECLASGRPRPVFLARESDGLDSGAVLAIGRALGSPENRVWRLAADQVRLLRQAEASLSVTLTYNDFYWTNLAVSRSEGGARRAIVFDYHLLGIGTRYSDYRNVTGSLGEAAGRAFHETYGGFDPREQVIDRPLSVLWSLVAGTSMPEFPAWAEDSRQRAASGGLERDLAEAIELARRLVAPTAPPL